MAEKIYRPEVIQETPFPGEPELPAILQPTPPTGTYTPTVAKDKNFPTKRIAQELISTALNTKSKKILQEFELEQSGGWKIGDYKKGVTGDVRITPLGIVMRDKAGLVTVGMYAEDGSAVFKGTIQAGSIIAAEIDGDLITAGTVEADKLNVNQLDAVATNTGTLSVDESIAVGGSVNGVISVKDSSNVEKVLLDNTGITVNTGKLTIKDNAETTIIDSGGLVSTATFNFAMQSPSNQQVTGTGSSNWLDIPNTSQTISLARDTYVLVLVTILCNMVDPSVTGKFRMNVGGDVGGPIAVFGVIQDGSGQSTETLWYILQASNNDVFKLQCAASSGKDMVFQAIKKSYIVLGK